MPNWKGSQEAEGRQHLHVEVDGQTVVDSLVGCAAFCMQPLGPPRRHLSIESLLLSWAVLFAVPRRTTPAKQR